MAGVTVAFSRSFPLEFTVIPPDARPRAETPLLPERLQEMLLTAGFVLLYVGLEWLSFIHDFNGLPVTPWNPGLGVAFALMVLRGSFYALALFLGIVISEAFILGSSLATPVMLAVAAIISAGYGAAAFLVRKKFGLDAGLAHLRDVLILLAAGSSAAICVTLLLTGTLVAAGELASDDIWLPALAFLVGDLIGIAITTPLLLRLVRKAVPGGRRVSPQTLGGLALLTCAVAVAVWLVAGSESRDGYKLFYVLFLPVVAAAVRGGLDGACIGLALTQIGLVSLLRARAYDALVFTEFQAMMLTLTITGLIAGIVMTERREADRLVRAAEARIKDKENELARAARFSLVSGLASALAHEINQPMAAARALARSAQQLMNTPGGDLARADRNLETAMSEIDRASGIVRRMREFLRRGKPQITPIDFAELVAELLPLIRPDATARKIVLQDIVSQDLPIVSGDPVQIQQVILNLIRNALDAIASRGMPDGRVEISARLSDDGRFLVASVGDNGPGIAADVVDRLFDPLTTSKPEGLGLGLSICRTIVEAHRGRIWLDQSPGATFFRFSIPLETTISKP